MRDFGRCRAEEMEIPEMRQAMRNAKETKEGHRFMGEMAEQLRQIGATSMKISKAAAMIRRHVDRDVVQDGFNMSSKDLDKIEALVEAGVSDEAIADRLLDTFVTDIIIW